MAYDAIVLDTQTIDNYKWLFNEGMLLRMRQFCTSQVKFIMPDIVKNEVLSHLSKKIKESQDNLEKSLKDALKYSLLNNEEVKQVHESAIQIVGADALASTMIESFLASCGAVEIQCGKLTNVEELFEAYFNLTPPFADRKKRKEEFPDATVLFAIEAYAKKLNIEILAVSRDQGWVDYCNKSDYVTCIHDLGEALTHFQPRTAPYEFAQRLMLDVDAGSANLLLDSISAAVIDRYDDVDFIAEADSYLSYDTEPNYCHVTDVQFQNSVNVIDVNDDYATFEIKATVTYSAECEFNFYHYDSIDKDNVYLAGITESTEVDDTTSIIFTIYNGVDKDYDDMDVEEVELTSVIKYIDFGSIEPHYEPDND
ncbi:PIN domain-containing protein [Citrobacter sp.]|uniref:PIN domain-containing protein n=1 Tax=Citrobacter sp. TaxID=1896336 RepID=UPI002FC76CE7